MNQETLQQYLESGVTLFGAEAMKDASELVLGADFAQIPSEYHPLLSPAELNQTFKQLDDAMSEVANAGYAKEMAYTGMGDLKAAVKAASAAVALKEAEAFMQIKGDGKDAYAIVDGEKMSVTNDKAREALRKHHAKEEHKMLSDAQTQVDIKQYYIEEKTVAYERAVELSRIVNNKATLQGNLLLFLAKG